MRMLSLWQPMSALSRKSLKLFGSRCLPYKSYWRQVTSTSARCAQWTGTKAGVLTCLLQHRPSMRYPKLRYQAVVECTRSCILHWRRPSDCCNFASMACSPSSRPGRVPEPPPAFIIPSNGPSTTPEAIWIMHARTTSVGHTTTSRQRLETDVFCNQPIHQYYPLVLTQLKHRPLVLLAIASIRRLVESAETIS